MDSKDFIKMVEMHERAWGKKSYRGRPSLSDMLSQDVVMFFSDGEPYHWKANVYGSLQDLESQLSQSILRNLAIGNPLTKIERIYFKQKRIMISNVKLKFNYQQE